MLVGRAAERRRIDEALDAARTGRESAVLVLRGEAGIGKSALLADAAARAGPMTVLSVRGIESEAELAFGGLHELLLPLLGELAAIPEPQARALAGALALGPPAGDRFAIGAGTLSLLAEAAERRPVLMLVDDVQWLDAPSADAIRYAARRLSRERVATLAAVRGREPSALDGAGLPELVLAGLDDAAATELLRRTAGAVETSVAERLCATSEGNPLFLTELGALLTPAQLAGTEAVPDPLPAGSGIERALGKRLDGLDDEARRALVVAAAAGDASVPVILAAVEAAGLGPGALERAENAGILEQRSGRFEWRHPLVRSSAFHRAEIGARRSAHAALASVLEPGDGARAWHLAAAASGPDESAAAALDAAAAEARVRIGHLAAAEASERAARLTGDPNARAQRLLEAGRDFGIGGRRDRSRALLREALDTGRDPRLRAAIQLQRGIAEMWSGSASEARRLLQDEAARVEPVDPVLAVPLLSGAAIAAQMAGFADATLTAARAAAAIAERATGELPGTVANILVSALVIAGKAEEAERQLPRLLVYVADPDARERDDHAVTTAGHTLVWLGRHDEARRMLDAELARRREGGALGELPYLLACSAELDFRVGRWDAALAAASEAVQLADETEQRNLLGFALAILATVEAGLGRRADAERDAVAARGLGESLGAGSLTVYALSAQGLARLGTGDLEAALDAFEPLDALVDELGVGEPGIVRWRADLIEAAVLAGRKELAEASVARLEHEAEATGRAWAAAAAARGRAMLSGREFEQEFERALELHEQIDSPFDSARTKLRLGERLRRERRSGAARGPLREALAIFERLGAMSWGEHTRAELAATGAKTSSVRPGRARELTPQELRIALLVSEGATNAEVATALFLSPKTVAYHLSKVYAKLQVRSRVELATHFARHGGTLMLVSAIAAA